jgi:hypothetical protein
MGELGEILHDQVRADAIARQICKRGLEDVHSSEHGELVEHQQDRIHGIGGRPGLQRSPLSR